MSAGFDYDYEMYKKLKKCPYCNTEDSMGSIVCWWDPKNNSYRVECQKCLASTKEFVRPDEAMDAWNNGGLE